MTRIRILDAMFSSPRELLDKASYEGDFLVDALRAQDEQKVAFSLFNFAVTAYHVWDWIKFQNSGLDRESSNPLNRMSLSAHVEI